jgi:hypothetical protein
MPYQCRAYWVCFLLFPARVSELFKTAQVSILRYFKNHFYIATLGRADSTFSTGNWQPPVISAGVLPWRQVM